jgi:hypothetical protein
LPKLRAFVEHVKSRATTKKPVHPEPWAAQP